MESSTRLLKKQRRGGVSNIFPWIVHIMSLGLIKSGITLPMSWMLYEGISHDYHPVCSQTDPETSNYGMFLFHPSSRARVEICRDGRDTSSYCLCIENWEAGDTVCVGTVNYLFLRQRAPSTISPYASLNNCKAFGEMSAFWNTRFSSAAAKSLSPICSGKPTRESTWWMLSATNNRVMSKRDFVVYLRLPSAL